MPLYDTQQQQDAYTDVHSVGPVAQAYPFNNAALAPPASLGATATWNSSVLTSDGFKAMSVGVTLSQAGTLTVKRFIDQNGQVPLDSQSITLTGGTAAFKSITDNIPFGSFVISIANTSASSGTISNFAVLMNAT